MDQINFVFCCGSAVAHTACMPLAAGIARHTALAVRTWLICVVYGNLKGKLKECFLKKYFFKNK